MNESEKALHERDEKEVKMKRILENLEPEKVFWYFEEISRIPRGSGNTEAISSYCEEFAQTHDLDYIRDGLGNIVIFKPGSPGYEASEPLVLQGHLDMVCEKNFEYDSRHDFKKDGLNLAVMDDYIYAKGTTLGGDDGIAVAYLLTILSDPTIKHPSLEAVFTVDEEIGMLGATAFNTACLHGKRLINIDNEVEGELLTSNAGGRMVTCEVPVRYCEKQGVKYNLVICGLLGGHSGMEIDKYRGNANLLLGRLLHYIGTKISFDISYLKGGLQDNAIPREAKAEILVHEKDAGKLENYIHEFEATIRNEYRTIENNIMIYCENMDRAVLRVLTPKTKERIIFLLMTIPDGIEKMSPDTDHLVQTSSNAGIMRLSEAAFELIISIRSSVSSEKQALSDKLKYLTETIGGKYRIESNYPAWEYREKSKLRDLMFRTFQQYYGHNPSLTGIHAGLECGIFYEKMEGVDIVSFGPNIENIHTPREKLSISSVKRTWEYLLQVLENCK